jgi:hypothetical protein
MTIHQKAQGAAVRWLIVDLGSVRMTIRDLLIMGPGSFSLPPEPAHAPCRVARQNASVRQSPLPT